MNSSILDKEPSWMATATEAELREFLHEYLDEMEDCPRYRELKAAFDRECSRRSGEYYEQKNGGEWI